MQKMLARADGVPVLMSGLKVLADELGEDALFIGPSDYQLRPEDIGSPTLFVVTDLATATRALHMIIVQGEGAPTGNETSHFEKFTTLRREYDQLLDARPSFKPARNVARNPVMRRPNQKDRVHVVNAHAAPLLDACNATYSLMLRCLTAAYETPARSSMRGALLSCAIGLMKALAIMSDVLIRLSANDHD